MMEKCRNVLNIVWEGIWGAGKLCKDWVAYVKLFVLVIYIPMYTYHTFSFFKCSIKTIYTVILQMCVPNVS